MKVESVSTIECFCMYTDEGTYYRYGADSWYVLMGESYEPVYECEHLEIAFQEFKKNNVEKEVMTPTLREFIAHLNSFCDEVKDKPFAIRNKNGSFENPLVCMVSIKGETNVSMPMSEIAMVTIESR